MLINLHGVLITLKQKVKNKFGNQVEISAYKNLLYFLKNMFFSIAELSTKLCKT